MINIISSIYLSPSNTIFKRQLELKQLCLLLAIICRLCGRGWRLQLIHSSSSCPVLPVFLLSQLTVCYQSSLCSWVVFFLTCLNLLLISCKTSHSASHCPALQDVPVWLPVPGKPAKLLVLYVCAHRNLTACPGSTLQLSYVAVLCFRVWSFLQSCILLQSVELSNRALLWELLSCVLSLPLWPALNYVLVSFRKWYKSFRTLYF